MLQSMIKILIFYLKPNHSKTHVYLHIWEEEKKMNKKKQKICIEKKNKKIPERNEKSFCLQIKNWFEEKIFLKKKKEKQKKTSQSVSMIGCWVCFSKVKHFLTFKYFFSAHRVEGKSHKEEI